MTEGADGDESVTVPAYHFDMATEDPSGLQSPAPTATDEQQAPAEQGGAPLVDIEKDAVSPELGGKGSRAWTKSERSF